MLLFKPHFIYYHTLYTHDFKEDDNFSTSHLPLLSLSDLLFLIYLYIYTSCLYVTWTGTESIESVMSLDEETGGGAETGYEDGDMLQTIDSDED